MENFKPMLAKDADLNKLRFPLAVQAKLDGIRVCIVDGRALTRTLKEVPNREIFEALSQPEFNGLDGEVIVGDPLAEDCYRKTSSFVMAPNKTGEPWAFHVFDSFNSPDDPFITRYADAREVVDRTLHTDLPIFMVNTEIAGGMGMLEAIEVTHIEQGHEGVIVRDPNGTYKFGRSYPRDGKLLKVKAFKDFEAEVIGVYEKMHNANAAVRNALGRTERSTKAEGMVPTGTLGGLVLRALNGPHAGQEFRCGTGFDDATRDELWSLSSFSQSSAGARVGLNGRIAVIKHFPIGAKDKPRFPVWKGWRIEADLPSLDEDRASEGS